jgi:hypothetical protein
MGNYPEINWWLGNLYPYESVLSFAARFCTLNSINIRQLYEYFKIHSHCELSLSEDQIVRIAKKLGDDTDIARTVFSTIDDRLYHLRYRPSSSKRRREIRYCEDCIRNGYHSCLHEVGWIYKCPLHQCELKTATIDAAGVIFELKFNVLTNLMRQHCNAWPFGSENLFFLREMEKIYSIENWIVEANNSISQDAHNEVWVSRLSGNSLPPLSQVFGQIISLKAPPKSIAPIFSDFSQGWSIKKNYFNNEIKDELHRVTSLLCIDDVFRLYKYVKAFSEIKSPFSSKLKSAQEIIKSKHSKCECNWILMREGWGFHWVKMNPEYRPYSGIRCPYEEAINELELGWGRHDIALSRRLAMNSMNYYFTLITMIKELGLFKLVNSIDGIGAEWNEDSPLSELFNTMAECEIKVQLRNMVNWLDFIEDGGHPSLKSFNSRCVRLCETDEGLTLIRWIPPYQIIH